MFTATGAKFINCTFYGNTAGAGGPGGPGGNAYLPNNYYYPYPGGNGGNAGNAGSGTIYCPTGVCQLVACTFLNNSAGAGGNAGSGGNGSADFSGNGYPGGSGGNAGAGGSGGALYGPRSSSTNFTLQNVLVAGNYYGYAGSPGGAGSSGGSRLISGTPGTNGIYSTDGTGADLSGFFTSRGRNLISLRDGSTGFTNGVKSDLVGSGSPLDPMLGSLADNHGPVMTCALLAGSPALDAGDDSLIASNIVKDARGYARKSGAHVDIGAYEFQAPSAQIKCQAVFSAAGAMVTFSNTPGALFTLLGTTDLTLPVENWDVLGPMPETSPGLFQWTDTDSFNYEFRYFTVRTQ